MRLEADDPRPPLVCGDRALDEFYAIDSIEGEHELLSVTYVFTEGERAVAFLSLSNDAISKEAVPRSSFERLQKVLTREKRYRSLPAAKIGRIGVARDLHGQGIGTDILDFLKTGPSRGTGRDAGI